MPTKILLLSDIHGNYPALAAIDSQVKATGFDLVINGGDTTVYAPFPNETVDWLRQHRALSILGNTDRKINRLLQGKPMKKPVKAEKRIMYTWTAERLNEENQAYLAGVPGRIDLDLEGFRVGIYHGSPANEDEFLFNDTPGTRFEELARKSDRDIIITGHSHTPYHKKIRQVHFINPGSAGRMFDGSPDAAYAVLELSPGRVKVELRRCPYAVEEVVDRLRQNLLPPIYAAMFRTGRKLN